jgi:hypothetical protein
MLSDYECSIKHRTEGHHLNTCLKCLQGLGIPFVGNQALSRKPVLEDDDEVMLDNENNCMDDLIYTNIDKFSEDNEEYDD